MIKVSQSLIRYLRKYHKDIVPQVNAGDIELVTPGIWKGYLEWCTEKKSEGENPLWKYRKGFLHQRYDIKMITGKGCPHCGHDIISNTYADYRFHCDNCHKYVKFPSVKNYYPYSKHAPILNGKKLSKWDILKINISNFINKLFRRKVNG